MDFPNQFKENRLQFIRCHGTRRKHSKQMPDSRNNHLLLNEWRVGDIMNVHTNCTIASQSVSQPTDNGLKLRKKNLLASRTYPNCIISTLTFVNVSVALSRVAPKLTTKRSMQHLVYDCMRTKAKLNMLRCIEWGMWCVCVQAQTKLKEK